MRENILDKGYAAEDFVTYLISKKGDEGVDLGNWSLNELKLVVQEYILTHPILNNQIGNNAQSLPQVQNNFTQNNPIQNQFQAQNPNLNQNMNDFNNNMNYNNMGMNQNMNMGMNNMINNINNPQLQNNMNQNYMSYVPDNEPEEQTDIYGITNLETILCSICEKSELSKCENIHIEISLGEKVAGTFFTKAYMTYIISKSQLNLKVIKKYTNIFIRT